MPQNLTFGDNSPRGPTRDSPVDLLFGQMLTPLAGVIGITGGTPEVSFEGLTVTPIPGVLEIAGLGPVVSVAGFLATPIPGVLEITGVSPLVTFQGVLASPTTGVLEITGGTPLAITPKVAFPIPGVVAITGVSPLVEIRDGIIIVADPVGAVVTEGRYARYYVDVQGVGPFTYQWYETTAGSLVGETGKGLTVGPVVIEDDGLSYYCIIEDGIGAKQSVTAFLSVRLFTPPPLLGTGGNVDVFFALSGGAGNVDPKNSLGGPASIVSGGIPMSQLVQLSSGSVDGVEFIGANNSALGVGTLSWDVATQKLTWTDSAANSDTVYAGGSSGLYQTSSSNGRAVLRVSSNLLSGGNQSADYYVHPWGQNLFDEISYIERQGNHVNYRAMYLRNNADYPITDVSVLPAVTPAYGTVGLTTEYFTSVGSVMSAEYVESLVVSRAGKMKFGAKGEFAVNDYIDYYREGPLQSIAYPSTVAVQDSDGATTGLATQIVDEYDSTNIVAGLSYKSVLQWETIDAGKYVSFWVRRSVNANTSGTALTADSFKLRVLYTGG